MPKKRRLNKGETKTGFAEKGITTRTASLSQKRGGKTKLKSFSTRTLCRFMRAGSGRGLNSSGAASSSLCRPSAWTALACTGVFEGLLHVIDQRFQTQNRTKGIFLHQIFHTSPPCPIPGHKAGVPLPDDFLRGLRLDATGSGVHRGRVCQVSPGPYTSVR